MAQGSGHPGARASGALLPPPPHPRDGAHMSEATSQPRALGSRKPPLLPVGHDVLRSQLSLSRPGQGTVFGG